MFELRLSLKNTINRKESLPSVIPLVVNFIVCLTVPIIDLFIRFRGDYKTGTTPLLNSWGGIVLFITTVMVLITLWCFLTRCVKRLRDTSLSGP